MNDETRRVIHMLEKRIDERFDAEMRRLAELRSSDALAITVAYNSVERRLEGFPQQYATKSEQDVIKETAIRLDRSSLSREVYEERHEQLSSQIAAALPAVVFDTTLREWAGWRNDINKKLDEQQGQRRGVSALFVWGIAAAGVAVGVISLILAYHPA